ncbi:MAG: shikimate kinase [Prevotellaceae bacterium]|jgi:shikimate kinase|nr:shikimate kinase [Prevotellaceae bacterium]
MKSIFLIGYMGTGKTTLGKLLSARLGMPFVDLDAYIEKRFFKSIAQVFEERGEDGFRKTEAAMLRETVDFENTIVATGGGTPCFFDNMALMNERGVTIYLQTSPETLCETLAKAKSKRPLIADKTDEELLAFIKENVAKREAFYTQARFTVNMESDIENIVQGIVELLQQND